MKDLVERVARELARDGVEIGGPDSRYGTTEERVDRIWTTYRSDAVIAIRAVLSHFSEPGNVTEEMTAEFGNKMAKYALTEAPYHRSCAVSIASAMRAALEEFKQ